MKRVWHPFWIMTETAFKKNRDYLLSRINAFRIHVSIKLSQRKASGECPPLSVDNLRCEQYLSQKLATECSCSRSRFEYKNMFPHILSGLGILSYIKQ